jgi:hypothetical protein
MRLGQPYKKKIKINYEKHFPINSMLNNEIEKKNNLKKKD